MFGIGMPELIVIMLIILIIFGAGKLPEIGSGLGKAIRGFKKGLTDADDIEISDNRKEKDNNNSKNDTEKNEER
ncbi:MAG: twin-arginine translocase TatA/TatE family subunit [Nitrospirota bacterium]